MRDILLRNMRGRQREIRGHIEGKETREIEGWLFEGVVERQ